MNPPNSASPPSRERLQDALHTLHEELARTPRVDADSRRLLHALLGDVQRLLHGLPRDAAGAQAQPDAAAAAQRPSARLEGLAVQFEAEHPLLAGSLRQFVELCSRAGL